MAQELVLSMDGELGNELVSDLVNADQSKEAGVQAQRERVKVLKQKLAGIQGDKARRLEKLADYLVKKSVWIIGGDGWAYDIGFGGLDHILAMNRKVNILVLDTEVYSNTGGQQSKSTPMGASAKFAISGKASGKKDLGLIAMSYGNVYVARVAFGAKDAQTLKAFEEAESYPGPAIIIAYSHCIAHGYDLSYGLEQQKLAVDAGYWPLYRFDPRQKAKGEAPMQLDSQAPKDLLGKFMRNETRFRMVEQMNPDRFRDIVETARHDNEAKFAMYAHLAKLSGKNGDGKAPGGPAVQGKQ